MKTRRPFDRVELADVEEQFDECDADGDQRIDFAEFSTLLGMLGSEMRAAQRRTRFDIIDTNRDGVIDRNEFVDWLRSA